MKDGYVPIASNTAVVRVDILRALADFQRRCAGLPTRSLAQRLQWPSWRVRHPEPLDLSARGLKAIPKPWGRAATNPGVNALLGLLAQPELRDIVLS